MTRSNETRPSRALGRVLCVAAAALLASAPGAAIAQQAPSDGSAQASPPPRSRQSDASRFSLRGSMGLTAGPETFNMTLEVPWQINRLVSVGPLFQLGFSDDEVLFAPTVQAYITPQLDGGLEDWHPYVHLGMGLIYLEKDGRRGGRDEEDTDFLFATGLGIEYALRDDFFMGTGFLFNVIPAGAVGERFVFGWQMLMFRVEF